MRFSGVTRILKMKNKYMYSGKGVIMPGLTEGKPGELIDLERLTFSTSLACRYIPRSLKGYLLSKEGWIIGNIKLKVFGRHYVRIPKKCRCNVLLKYNRRYYDEKDFLVKV